MGEENPFFPNTNSHHLPFRPHFNYPTRYHDYEKKRKRNNREKTFVYPAMMRTTQPTINTSDSVAK